MDYWSSTFTGKMELLSSEFKNLVQRLFEQNKTNIIATIPLPKAKQIAFVESLRNRTDCTTFHVTKCNRNTIEREIMSAINR